MYRQHRLVREAIAQRAAEVNRLAAQYQEDARGDCCQPADGLVRTRRRRRLRRVSPGRSQDTVGAFLPGSREMRDRAQHVYLGAAAELDYHPRRSR